MRYALYFAPAVAHPLWLAGNAWLGRDPQRDGELAVPDVPGFTPQQIAASTASPRRYGLHATIKAPFRLPAERSEEELLARLSDFCAAHMAFDLPPMQVVALDDFVALGTVFRSQELHDLADACVRHFDDFRAPPDAAELARRRPEKLDAEARARLLRWGYPHVFAGFEFHVSLTGAMAADLRDALLPWLAVYFAPALAEPLAFDALALYVEPEPGAAFRLRQRFPLSGGRQ
jgi:putative phosphonate metabolism protein